MDTSTFLAILGICGTLLGALIGAGVGLYGLKQQDERRNKREDEKKATLDKRRKDSAYRQLKAHTDSITALDPRATQYSIRSEQLDAMNSLIIQNFDVLDESTRGAWDTKGVAYSSTPPWITLTFAAFVRDINDHYEALRYNAIPTES